MNPSDHLKRSLLRRGVLYAGDLSGAERVLEAVLLAQSDLPRLADNQRDRLLIQRSRETGQWGGAGDGPVQIGGVKLDGPAGQLWKSLARLDRQQREAMLLIDLEGYDEIPAARAMDCSRTAMGRFHDAAKQTIEPILGDALPAGLDALREAMEAIDVEPSAAAVDGRLAHVMARRRVLTLAKFAVLFVLMAIVAWVGYDLLRSDEGRSAPPSNQPQPPDQPAPLTPEEQALQDRIRQQEEGEAAGNEIKRP